jgi:hypothetical protein
LRPLPQRIPKPVRHTIALALRVQRTRT